MSWLVQALFAALLTAAAALALFGVVGVFERERRAVWLSGAIALALALGALGLTRLPASFAWWIAVAGWVLVVGVLLYLVAAREPRITPNGRPAHRVDERVIMFARARLEPGSEEFERYYREHPEHLASDNRLRRLPGLLSPRAKLAEPVAPRAATDELERRVLEAGARDVGATRLRAYHVYSHVGRGTGTWGEPIEVEESWALAFTVEMDHQTMRAAPAAPVVAESARRYVQAARIAVDVAETIRSWGYPARAHIDGNYQVIAPLVAADAGLGEIGRMGILMTPRLGPRVRLGVVTTALPLSPDRPGDDPSVLDFCTRCRKCAENCPPRAIPFGDRTEVDSGLRWRLDSDACFAYWSAIGTDCGRCMTVCPYSHPDNTAHNLVRRLISASPGARRPLLWADDLFYGRRPAATAT